MKDNIRFSTAHENKKIESALDLIRDLIEFNDNIESKYWLAALIASISISFKSSGIPFKEFRNEIRDAFDHYEYLWKE
jgi:hypothetical protein